MITLDALPSLEATGEGDARELHLPEALRGVSVVVLDEWIGMDMTLWLQIRPVSPGGPKNRWALRAEGGSWGRAVQYPFVKPKPGEWHSPWHAWRVDDHATRGSRSPIPPPASRPRSPVATPVATHLRRP